MRERRTSRRTQRSPDRRLLLETILPAVAAEGARVLWVGCRRYTSDYPAILEASGGVCWTSDIAEDAAAFGRNGRHRTGDLQEVDRLFADQRFGAVLCNGVFGYGVDDEAAQRKAMVAMSAVLQPAGTLLLGWNTDKIDDPLRPSIIGDLFEPAARWGLPTRTAVPGTTHVYDLLRRIDL